VLHEPVGQRRFEVTPLAIALLHACRAPLPFAAIRDGFPGLTTSTVRRVLGQMVRSGAIVRRVSPSSMPAATQPAGRWGKWSPAATFFHFATKNVAWASGEALQEFEDTLRARAAIEPPPPAMKRIDGRVSVPLPRAVAEGEFRSVLLDRRTWRGFASVPVSLAALAELLDLTFGVRRWVGTDAGERLPLKTSPSAGGRHPIEAYVLAPNVQGLAKGLYHYAPDRHRLERLRRGATPGQIEGYLGGQWWYGSAGAVVLMTAVLPRVWWRYDMPRAYRSVLLDAGHVCQTFCLVATALQLAPFCTMALADSRIERDLGIDGVSEIVLYAAGVGVRPGDGYVQWPSRPAGRTYVSPDLDDKRGNGAAGARPSPRRRAPR
jgi:SagB-type dehydrogenase family enzyme